MDCLQVMSHHYFEPHIYGFHMLYTNNAQDTTLEVVSNFILNLIWFVFFLSVEEKSILCLPRHVFLVNKGINIEILYKDSDTKCLVALTKVASPTYKDEKTFRRT